MTGEQSGVANQDPWQEAAGFAERYARDVQEAQAIAYPERAHEDPLEVFPEPSQPRGSAPDPGFSEDQTTALREVGSRLGFGGEYDMPADADYELVEGGKPWKVLAEVQVARGIKIYTASPNRKIGADEAEFLRTLQLEPQPEETEYGMVARLAAAEPGFEALDEPLALPFGYDIDNEFAPVEGPGGQLVQLGVTDGLPVYLLRVDREDYYDEDAGRTKYRHQPQSTDLMKIVGEWLKTRDDDASSVGLLTSSAYPSRLVSAVSAGLTNGRRFTAGMYSRQTLADVRGETAAEPVGINQLPGELWEISFRLKALQSQLAEHAAE